MTRLFWCCHSPNGWDWYHMGCKWRRNVELCCCCWWWCWLWWWWNPQPKLTLSLVGLKSAFSRPLSLLYRISSRSIMQQGPEISAVSDSGNPKDMDKNEGERDWSVGVIWSMPSTDLGLGVDWVRNVNSRLNRGPTQDQCWIRVQRLKGLRDFVVIDW